MRTGFARHPLLEAAGGLETYRLANQRFSLPFVQKKTRKKDPSKIGEPVWVFVKEAIAFFGHVLFIEILVKFTPVSICKVAVLGAKLVVTTDGNLSLGAVFFP